jgi:hypothetical protein
MIIKVFSVFLFLFSFHAFAWDSTVTPKYRFYPMTASISASISKENILWDARNVKQPWNYGMYRLTLNGGAEGSFEGTVTYYPVSIVKIFAGVGGTYRYYNIPTFNCDLVTCDGFVQRSHLGFSFAMAFGEEMNWILIPTYEQFSLSTSNSSKPIADEAENILAAANSDTFDSVSLLAGQKRGISLYGLYIRQGRFRNSCQFNEIQAAIVKSEWRETSFLFGLGRYASSYYTPGITFFISYEWRWGKSQALF